MKKYTDIFIDFDDTLYDTRGNATIALKELFDYMHLDEHFDDPQKFFDAYWEANVDLWSQYSRGEIKRDYLMVERFRRPLSIGKHEEGWPSVDYCLAVSDKFLEFCSDKPGTVCGAKELLDDLKEKGYRLHICSNGFHEVQYKKLKACGLFSYFDTIILSEDAGANKPSRQFFDYAIEKTNAKPESTLMIGDNYNTDIEGAMTADIDTMLFRRWDPTFQPPKEVTFMVDSLQEIMQIL